MFTISPLDIDMMGVLNDKRVFDVVEYEAISMKIIKLNDGSLDDEMVFYQLPLAPPPPKLPPPLNPLEEPEELEDEEEGFEVSLVALVAAPTAPPVAMAWGETGIELIFLFWRTLTMTTIAMMANTIITKIVLPSFSSVRSEVSMPSASLSRPAMPSRAERIPW